MDDQLRLGITEVEVGSTAKDRNLIRDLTDVSMLALRVFEIHLESADADQWVRVAYDLFHDLRDYGGGYTILAVGVDARGRYVRVLAWVDSLHDGMFPLPNVGPGSPTAL